MKEALLGFLEKYQRIFLFLGDVIAIFMAFALGTLLAEPWYHGEDSLHNILFFSWTTYAGMIGILFFLHCFRLYRFTWRYAGVEVHTAVVGACCCGMIVLFVLQHFYLGFTLNLALFVCFVFLVLFITLVRTLASMMARYKCGLNYDIAQKKIKKLLILGSYSECAHLIKSFDSNFELKNYKLIGALTYDKEFTGRYIGKIPVFGTYENMVSVAEKKSADEVLIILDKEYDSDRLKESVLKLRRERVPVKTINMFSDRVSGVKKLGLKDIKVEDLLHRESRQIDLKLYGDYIKDKVVMVTGGGGSIGSEIVRQVSALGPKQLIILGHGENSVFKIHANIKDTYPDLNIYPVIASISDRESIFDTFEKFRPDVVFHAAAHKHVPLMEMNIREAVKNNICGTLNVADACFEFGVKTMVQISTDKAADPSSVMGATKFVCEQIVKSTARRENNKTKFVIVRFGNVLGSRGSVIPVFLRQIQNGGPVTVTDPKMTRFFMIIPEACRLVIQSGSIGGNGKIYVLDMGEPVKILDLAEDIISLCGYVPGKDMEIKFTGIRPGEKLHETLSSRSESLEATEYSGINTVASTEVCDYAYLTDFIKSLNTPEKTENADIFISEVQKLKK
ncbi:MAG: polysaccharide biosynthesis protein [Armatimonadetes bacterium]|nr:polysaccharide biosynthesis protein [Candidatus Hippobium faecium]